MKTDHISFVFILPTPRIFKQDIHRAVDHHRRFQFRGRLCIRTIIVQDIIGKEGCFQGGAENPVPLFRRLAPFIMFQQDMAVFMSNCECQDIDGLW